jgi:hypothetical protein
MIGIRPQLNDHSINPTVTARRYQRQARNLNERSLISNVLFILLLGMGI